MQGLWFLPLIAEIDNEAPSEPCNRRTGVR